MKEILHKVKPFIRVITILFIIGVLVIISFVYKFNVDNNTEEELVVSTNQIDEDIKLEQKVEAVVEATSYIYVDVKGAVKKPGVYKLEEGSRVIDAINKSGGLNKNADTSVVNLSKKLEDGNVIIIYTSDYIEERKKEEIVIEYIEKDCVCTDNTNDGCINDNEIIVEQPENNDNSNENIIKKVSLNKATLEELLTLPGIGKSKAEDILNYIKENGEFKTIDEIKEVKGIGDALFEKIKEHITI